MEIDYGGVEEFEAVFYNLLVRIIHLHVFVKMCRNVYFKGENFIVCKLYLSRSDLRGKKKKGALSYQDH